MWFFFRTFVCFWKSQSILLYLKWHFLGFCLKMMFTCWQEILIWKKKNITYLSVDCSCYLERNFVRLFKFGKRFMKFSDPVQSYQEKLSSQARRRYFEITWESPFSSSFCKVSDKTIIYWKLKAWIRVETVRVDKGLRKRLGLSVSYFICTSKKASFSSSSRVEFISLSFKPHLGSKVPKGHLIDKIPNFKAFFSYYIC